MNKIICLTGLALLFCAACGPPQNATTPSQNSEAESARRQKQAYLDRAEAKLRELDQQIDDLAARMREGSEQKRKELAPQMSDLQRRREFAKEKLERLKVASEQAWAQLQADFDAAVNDLEAEYKRANSHAAN